MSGVNNDEDKKPGTDDQEAVIFFKVKIRDGNEVLFKMKRSTQLKKLMYAYCNRHSVEHDSFAFMFDGRRIRGNQTPDELGMEEGDTIDALPAIIYPPRGEVGLLQVVSCPPMNDRLRPGN